MLLPGLAGATALVTGGDRGIGRAVVVALLAQGARVAFTHVAGSEAAAAAFVDDVGAARCSSHQLDLRSPASIDSCIEEVQARWGHFDVLVNNAAVGSATVAGFAEGQFERAGAMLAINAVGTLQMCRAAIAGSAPGPGRLKIVNLSSVGGGITSFPGFDLSDGMSKAAVAHLTRQLAAEHLHDGVEVFAVCPGATNTAMFQASTLDPMSPEERAAFLARLPRGRLIEPEEIAALIAVLCSSIGGVLHGAVIDASMGLGVRPGVLTEHPH